MKKILLFSSIFLAACGAENSIKVEPTLTNSPSVSEPVAAKQLSSESEKLQPRVIGRWYSQQQVDEGKQLFALTCAVCHGNEAQGLAENWKKPDDNGNYPPPPLDGSAHAWHHPITALKHTIREGGAPVGGVMPPFKSIYTDAQIESLIASFQSRWSDKVYSAWQKRNH